MANEQVPGPPLGMTGLAADLAAELQAKADRADAIGGNVLLNSNFAINTRGQATYTLQGGSLDGWNIRPGGVGSMTVSQGTPITEDAEFSLLWERDAAGGASDIVRQRLQDVRRFAGKRIVLSYDVISDAGGAVDFGVDVNQNFGSGGSADVSTADISVSATTTAARKVHVIDVPSVSGKTIGSGSYLELRLFRGTLTANGDIRIGNVDLREIPGSLTPTMITFASPDPLIEKRRAEHIYTQLSMGVTGFALNTTELRLFGALPRMRIAPTLSLIDTSIVILDETGSAFTSSGSAITFSRVTDVGFHIEVDGFTGLTAGRFVGVDQSPVWLAASAEL